jgi:prepilin-type N-terminal cleavage/methylation domain-containing protein
VREIRPTRSPWPRGFSLIEMLTVLMITTMIVIATMSVYSSVRRNVAVIDGTLDQGELPREILQRIAEDLDRLARPGFDTSVIVRNKAKNGYNIAQLIIENRFYGDNPPNKPQIAERITWQSDFDPYTNLLILYRSHSGIHLEDGLIDRDQMDKQEKGIEQYVPLATGITHFELLIPSGEVLVREWGQPDLPKAIRVLLSFAAPVQTETGDWIIPEKDLFVRTIAIDRTRTISFQFVKKEFDLNDLDSADPNAVDLNGQSEADAAKSDETESKDKTDSKSKTSDKTDSKTSPSPPTKPKSETGSRNTQTGTRPGR